MDQPRQQRDRHGRGLRGPLLPSTLPGARTRAQSFHDLVLDVAADIARGWAEELREVHIAIDDLPPAGEEVPLASAEPATATHPARVVVFRRPIEARARSVRAREDLAHDAVVEAVAELRGRSPDEIDPG